MNDNSTSVETTRVNRLSDHEFLLALAYLNQQGQTEYGFPPYDWELKFYTSSPLNFFTVSCRGGVMLNCQREGDMVRVIMDGHKLSTGILRARSAIYIPDSNFPDGTRRVVDEHEFKTLFVSGHGTLASGPQLELLFPYVKGEPGKPFTYDDFTSEQLEGLRGPKGESLTFSDLTPEQIEELRGPQGEPFTYDDFTPEQLEGLRGPQGKSLTYDDLTPGQIAELQRPATEAAQLVSSAIDDVTATNNAIAEAEQTRVAAEQERVEAEQERAREIAGLEQDIDKASKQCFIDLWNTAVGEYGCYNEATGFFELNGITDIPYAEAMEIYLHRATNSSSLSFQWGSNYKARTTIGIPCDSSRQNVALDNVTTLNRSIQVLRLAQPEFDEILTRSVTQFVAGTNVRRIVPIIRDNGVPNTNNNALGWNGAFGNCTRLEYVKISRLGSSLSLKGCPKFDMDCLKYIVDNAKGSDITITLHPDAYARVTDDIFAAAAAKNITIATP